MLHDQVQRHCLPSFSWQEPILPPNPTWGQTGLMQTCQPVASPTARQGLVIPRPGLGHFRDGGKCWPLPSSNSLLMRNLGPSVNAMLSHLGGTYCAPQTGKFPERSDIMMFL